MLNNLISCRSKLMVCVSEMTRMSSFVLDVFQLSFLFASLTKASGRMSSPRLPFLLKAVIREMTISLLPRLCGW